jgi:tetratricopeptide (TPR) repeat protein
MEKADLLFEKGRYREAAAAYQRALGLMPKNWNDGAAAFRLGECYFRLRDYPRAIAAYDRVALAYPSHFQPRALFQLGEAHVHLRAYAKARAAFYSLLLRQGRYGPEIAPYIERAYYRVADCYWLEAESLASARKGSGE